VEVSQTTFAKDTGVKLRLYERSGVREYVVVQPGNRKLAWHVLADGKYQRLEPFEGGLYRSQVFPGLWLDLEQLWKGDFAGMAETIRHGTATPEHAAFLCQLAARKR
jgi:Uma2 family endonuclease